jgi:AbrB family transcriptional regulator (stage V sporulation protein T)
MPIFICDRDAIIAVSGASKREYLDRKISRALEEILDARSLYVRGAGKETISITDDGSHYVSTAMPIISEGDITGAIIAGWQYDVPTTDKLDDSIESKLIQTAGLFLAKPLEG